LVQALIEAMREPRRADLPDDEKQAAFVAAQEYRRIKLALRTFSEKQEQEDLEKESKRRGTSV